MPNNRPILVGHRGASTVAPENTMASFHAARRLGADAVELDVHQSRDGQLVVHHDYSLERTTSGTGPIFNHDWKDLAALDAGSWYSDSFENERIPRLEEVLEIEGIEFEIELKGYTETIIDRALQAVENADLLHRVEFTSGNVSLLAELHRQQPEAKTGLFTPRREPWMTDEIYQHCVVGLAKFSVCQVIHVNAKHITSEIADLIADLDKTLHTNDALSPSDIHRAGQVGANRLSANDVPMAVAALGSS